MMRFKLFVFLILYTLTSYATHNRAGYISYTFDVNTGKYKFTIYTYTNPSSYGADKCSEELVFIDPSNPGHVTNSILCNRVNGTYSGNTLVDLTSATIIATYNTQLAESCGPNQGAMLLYPYPGYGGVKLNIYEGQSEMTLNAGTYIVGMVDPNLDSAIRNIAGGNGGSQNVAFALIDTLYINNTLGPNNTPLVINPPIDNACYHQNFCYNPAMKDIDGDSLTYSLVNFITGDTGGTFNTATAAFIPDDMSVNKFTGDLCWIAPWPNQQHGEYEIDMRIREYRKNPLDGRWHLIGTMLFAIQIYVKDCPPNSALSISLPPATGCAEAGQPYTSPTFTVVSPAGNSVTLTASGIPISGGHIGSNAVFSSSTGAGSASGHLSWVPSCEAVQLNPYYVTIKGSDNQTPSANTNYSNLTVQVVAPPVQNLTDTVKGDSIKLQWDAPAICVANQYNKINSYLIYRANNCITYAPDSCHTGVPPSSGFQLIGTTTNIIALHPIFYDDNNGMGLPAGNSYSYIVIAKFDDGSSSMACARVCITLHYGVPIITNVSVDSTDTQKGSIRVKWQKPLLGLLNLDTIKYPGPYYFSLNRLDALGTYTTSVYTSPIQPYYVNLNHLTDTTFTDTLMDTYTKGYTYKVYFYSGSSHSHTGSSAPASSVYASGVGHDKKVVLTWAHQTPWQDTLYNIYQQNSTTLAYTWVGSTHNITDTIYNLTNKHNYCFKVQSVGSYLNPNIISPLYNFSQKICATPFDDVPPCQPSLNITGDCDAAVNKLVWANPIHACGINDVLKYYIYYTPRQDSTLTKIDSVLNVNDTTYTTNVNTQSIAGCYVVVAVDSAGNQSPLNNESCTDNCPEYELPNIFTPNGDNTNDQYIPVKNRYIRSVDFILYNRWGEIIYEATNPSLGWDGKSKQMKQPVPDGVYFYTCTVYEIHYNGIKERKLKGFVQLIR